SAARICLQILAGISSVKGSNARTVKTCGWGLDIFSALRVKTFPGNPPGNPADGYAGECPKNI
ncbi:MAG: hypothetical protein LBJ82_05275, partial [Deltaproteobacteria bacterium]|nr:hypothetical protein [Deltaproteobacteria bacterium]